jgi:hypothetical protein
MPWQDQSLGSSGNSPAGLERSAGFVPPRHPSMVPGSFGRGSQVRSVASPAFVRRGSQVRLARVSGSFGAGPGFVRSRVSGSFGAGLRFVRRGSQVRSARRVEVRWLRFSRRGDHAIRLNGISGALGVSPAPGTADRLEAGLGRRCLCGLGLTRSPVNPKRRMKRPWRYRRSTLRGLARFVRKGRR